MIDRVTEFFAPPAWAQAAPGPASGPAGFLSMIPFVLIFVLFYVMMILPQQRQRKKTQQMLDALKKGDRVVTTGGLIGAVTNIHNDVVTVQVAEDVKVKVLRSAIASLREEPKEESETAKDSKPQIKFKPSENLKKLHRDIAKRVHPDLAKDEEQRASWQKLMAEANHAYEENDETRLQNILRECENR